MPLTPKKGDHIEVRVELIEFQFVRSAVIDAGNGGKLRLGSKLDIVVGDETVDARFCSAVGTELISWDSCVAMFELAAVLVTWLVAADCAAVAEALVVCGGSVNTV